MSALPGFPQATNAEALSGELFHLLSDKNRKVDDDEVMEKIERLEVCRETRRWCSLLSYPNRFLFPCRCLSAEGILHTLDNIWSIDSIHQNALGQVKAYCNFRSTKLGTGLYFTLYIFRILHILTISYLRCRLLNERVYELQAATHHSDFPVKTTLRQAFRTDISIGLYFARLRRSYS